MCCILINAHQQKLLVQSSIFCRIIGRTQITEYIMPARMVMNKIEYLGPRFYSRVYGNDSQQLKSYPIQAQKGLLLVYNLP